MARNIFETFDRNGVRVLVDLGSPLNFQDMQSIQTQVSTPEDVKTRNSEIIDDDGLAPEGSANRGKFFEQPLPPEADYKEGDSWMDNDDSNHLYIANKTLQWVSVRDGSIFSGDWSDVVDDGGKPDDNAEVTYALPGDENLAGRWSFNENAGSIAYDTSGNGSNGTISTATFAAGVAGTALTFDGASGDVQITDESALQDVWAGGGSFSAWINPNSDGENDLGRIWSKGAFLMTNAESASKVKLEFRVPHSGDNGFWQTTATEVDINVWSHVAVTYDSDSLSNNPILYVNGEVVAITETQTPTGAYSTDAGTDAYIGNFSTDARTFDGEIDEPRLYNDTLTANEVKALSKWPSGTKGQEGATTSVNLRDSTKVVLNDNDVKNIATMTAGETINGATLPVAVFVNKTDNEIYACDADDPDKLDFVGFAITNSTDGNSINVQFSNISAGFSGLTEGVMYYVQDDKTIGVTPGTTSVIVGRAVSATELFIDTSPSYSVVASDNLQDSADDSDGFSNTSYEKKKDITYNEQDGTIRIKFDLSDNNGAGTTYGRIYVNGIAVGTEQSTGISAFTTYSEDIAVNNGDLVQLYCKRDAGVGGTTRNFRLYYDKSVVVNPGTINLN